MTIFDDLVNGITKEVSKVQTRSQEMLQTYSLSNEVKELERKKNAKLMEIGRLVCDKHLRNADIADDVLKDKANEVAALDLDISTKQAELDGLKAQGDPDVSTSQKAQAKAGYTPTPGYECPSCHAPASRDKSFCPSCGEVLKPSRDKDNHDDDGPIDVTPNENN